MYQNLLYSTADSIATITINRPSVHNALNIDAIEELRNAVEQAGNDPIVRAVIITGAGDKAFAAGADIGEIAALSPTAATDFARRGQAVFNRIESLGKPVIAAVNGYALGGGCELAMACTLRAASERAVFGQPEVKLGVIPGYGGTQRLPRLIGKGRAMQMLLTGEMVDASEALRIGLVNMVVKHEELPPASEALAKRIIGNAPLAVKSCLDAVHRGLEMTQVEGQSIEAALFALCCATEDMKEGTKAFLEKRPPNFSGK